MKPQEKPYGHGSSYTPATDGCAKPFVPARDRYSPPASNEKQAPAHSNEKQAPALNNNNK